MTDREFDAIVIGGGPAGAQCVLWLTKLGLKACLLEKAEIGGLQARSPYSNSWLAVVQATTLARNVAANIERNISEQGCTLFRTSCERIDHSTERNVFLVSTALGPLSARNVILATGTSENTGGMESDRAVLGLVGAASMQCAGKDVAILGGGDAACEAYQIATQKGAARVRVFARSIRARKDMWGAVAAKDKRVGDYWVEDDVVRYGEGRFSPETICLCYGWAPVIPPLGFKVDLDQTGRIVVDPRMRSSFPGVYAIGDVNNHSYPCVATAVAEGVYAAKEIERGLSEHI